MAKTTKNDNATVKANDAVDVVATNNIPEDATVNAPDKLVKLEVIKQFYDKTLIKDGKKKPEHIRKATTVFEATEERAAELEGKGFVKRLK